MKICTIIGARPQFIKAAVVSRVILEAGNISEILIHTGQHFDANMSDVFFDELDIRRPDFHLKIGGGSHGQNTGRMIEAIETILMAEKPDWVLVYGDTGVKLYNNHKNGFQIEGIDIMINDNMQPILIECNGKPGFSNRTKKGIELQKRLIAFLNKYALEPLFSNT